jgi:hypothetical protein
MQRFLIFVLLSLAGCTVPLPQPHTIPPQQTVVRLAMAPDAAYQRAYTTFAKMPTATISTADATARTFGGELHHAVLMSVVVEPQHNGALVTISGHIPPMRRVIGEFTEVRDYARLLQGLP